MQRLLLLIAGLCLCVLAGCASSGVTTDVQTAVLQTTSGYGGTHFRTYCEEGESVYVKVSGEAPAAVLLGEPDPFASPVAALYFRQRLEVIEDSTTNYVHVSTTGIDEPAQGWVWRPLIASRVPLDWRGGEDHLEAEGAERASAMLNESGTTFRAVGGFSEPSPEEAWGRSPELKRAIRRVDDFEAGLARAMGSSWRVERYREFGKAGGLLDD